MNYKTITLQDYFNIYDNEFKCIYDTIANQLKLIKKKNNKK